MRRSGRALGPAPSQLMALGIAVWDDCDVDDNHPKLST